MGRLYLFETLVWGRSEPGVLLQSKNHRAVQHINTRLQDDNPQALTKNYIRTKADQGFLSS
jgi:hypothetical protein